VTWGPPAVDTVAETPIIGQTAPLKIIPKGKR
jgi:hypothetical protein